MIDQSNALRQAVENGFNEQAGVALGHLEGTLDTIGALLADVLPAHLLEGFRAGKDRLQADAVAAKKANRKTGSGETSSAPPKR